ncbi:MAG: hypothetical protein D3924_08515 [Candidatus Electrothrix sp. AR4]|nr:hypothetical protein [Candidatus Electrothrix sp. AR4]
MEKIIAELKEFIPFKDTTEVGDIVMVAAEETQMAAYALVSGIERDRSRKDEWWKVHLQLLSIPIQPLVWTLRTEQFTGQESFTMGGKARFIQAVRFETEPIKLTPEAPPDNKNKGVKKSGLRLVK